MVWNPLDRVVGFDKNISIRITAQEYKAIRRVVRNNRDVFYNLSHFVRASVLKDLRNYDKKGKKK